MKKTYIYLTVFIFATVWAVSGQTGIHYKAKLTDGYGNVLNNQSIDVQIDILDYSLNILYRENHSLSTDANGIFELTIGEGNAVQGNFSSLDWSQPLFYNVKINYGNGTLDYGNQKFTYIPSAKRSDIATIGMEADYNNVTNIPSYMADGDDKGGASEINELTDGASYSQGKSVYLGNSAGTNNYSSANYNTGIGFFALHYLTSGENNTAVGAEALKYNNGGENTALGYQALLENTNGNGNTAIGVYSSKQNQVGDYNVSIGDGSLENNTSGGFNVAVGTNALKNSFVDNNIAVGSNALSSLNSTSGVSGVNNIAFGAHALKNSELGSHNIAFGKSTAVALKDETNAIAIGDSILSTAAQYGSINEINIVAIGKNILSTTNDLGNLYHFVALGNYIMENTYPQSSLVALGVKAMNKEPVFYGIAIGKNAAYDTNSIIPRTGNIAIGKEASYIIPDFSDRTVCLGANSGYTGPNTQYSIAIGYGSGGVSNTDRRAEFGNSSVSWIGGQVTFSTTSDRRIKEDIREDVAGLDFILRLRPVTYHLDIHEMNRLIKRDGKIKDPTKEFWPTKYDIEKITMTGFIAQEVEQAAKEAGYDFSGVQKTYDDLGLYSLSYAEFTVPLVKATREQQKILEQTRSGFEALERETKKLSVLNENLLRKADNLIEELQKNDN